MTPEQFTERLDDELCMLSTGYTRSELLLFPEDDTGLDEIELKDELDAVDSTAKSVCQLFLEAIGEDAVEDDKNCAWGHDFNAASQNELRARLRELVEGE